MLVNQKLQTEKVQCVHCGLAFVGAGRFCCGGCESVYDFLQGHGLGRYYDLRNDFTTQKAAPIRFKKQSFLELKAKPERELNFYLEGIHCLGCLWVLEKLPEILPGVLHARLEMSTSVIHVAIDERTNFQIVANTLQQLGYRPHAIEKSAEEFQRNENRSILLRLGVAAACTGNIMLLSVSIYAGASGALARDFAWLSMLLSLPVFFYSATPLYQTAFAALKSKTLSVDLPIVFALLAGFAASLVSLIRGGNEVYCDSLSMLVFLLLSSRYLLRRMQQKHLSNAKLLDFLDSESVICIRATTKVEISVSQLKVGDILWIPAGGVLPCDGVVRSLGALLDLSLLSGESLPEKANPGWSAYAGTKNLGTEFLLECTDLGRETRLGRILTQLNSASVTQTALRGFADTAAKWFVGIVLSLAAMVLVYFHGNLDEGIRRALALVIVTCPCVLAFAVPLSLSLTNKLAAKRGILLKSPESLEFIPQIQEIFLDKTGTITEGNFTVISWLENARYSDEIQSAVYSLERLSRHPVARALVTFLEGKVTAQAVDGFVEVPGLGVNGSIGGISWQIKKSSQARATNNCIDIFRAEELVARISLGDQLRADSKSLLQKLGARKIFLLSGDREEICVRVARELGIPEAQIFSEKSPEQKAAIIKAHPQALMVGDGANDALALKSAKVGVAVHGSVELSLKNAAAFFSRPGLASLVELFQLAEQNRRVTIRNLVFSATYNVFAGALAITGMASPLWAAVLMPLSAITVFLSTTISIRGRT